MKKTLLLLFILATLSALGQVRPPLEANTVRALTELDARKTIKFRTDSLDKAVMAYVEWNANCFRFKRLAAGSAWSSWICAPDEVTLDANAKDVFEIPSGKLTFKSTGKNMALRVDASNKYEFAGTIILNDDYTAFGKNAAVMGYDTVVYGSDTTYTPVYDNVHKNVILLGHNSKASQDSTAFIGDSTIKQLWIAGSLNTKGILLEGDSAYMKHLVLQEADSGKIAKHMGKTIAWVDDDPDSLYFQGAWYVMGLDSISFADSIQINGQWVKFGESLTFPDSIQINGEWVHLGGSVTIAIPEAQTLNWNPDSRQLSISGGNSVTIEDECACSGATGTFYSKEGRLITVENGLIVSIGQEPSYFIIKTNSTNSSWSPALVSNSGATLQWDVAGAVIYSEETNDPTFNFSTEGEKIVTVSSLDNFSGLTDLKLYSLGITSFEHFGLDSLITLNLSDNQIAEFEISGFNNLETLLLIGGGLNTLTGASPNLKTLVLDHNQLQVFDGSYFKGLTVLNLNDNQLTAFFGDSLINLELLVLNNNLLEGIDVEALTNITYLDVEGNSLSSVQINSVLDLLASHNNAGRYFDARNQTGGGCGDPAKIAALDAIWGTVLVDACAVDPTGYIILKTDSESKAWGPYFDEEYQAIINTGATLHWEVTGAATYSVDTNLPVFDFSSPGEKIITITSSDDLAGLQGLDLNHNQVTMFDATGLTGLQKLYLSGNQLTTFDATGLTGLQKLYLSGNQLTTFDATGLTGLQELGLYGNQLTIVAINSMLDQLVTIGTAGNYLNAGAQVGGGCGDPAKIAALDAIWGTVLVDACAVGPTGYIILKTDSESNAWSPSGVANSGATLHWEVTGAATYSVDTNLPVFDFSTPGEKVITITSSDDLTGLQYLNLSGNQLTTFDATGLTGLQRLVLNGNQLTSFDATGLTGLQELGLSGNQLTTFDATGLTGLQYLDIGGNQLTTFDATGLTGLQTLGLYGNQLTTFDATGLTGLQTLNLYGNQLTTFDATGLTGLQTLNLSENQLTSFDATGLTGLQELNLSGNQLTTTSINTMLDQLITIGTAGNYLYATAQVGGGCGDPAKIAALAAIWMSVSVDACE